MEYTVDYFINKFENIPEENWCTHSMTNGNRHCALGHCGARDAEELEGESKALWQLAYDKHCILIMSVNDKTSKQYPQPTPKQRILAALYDIKSQQALTEAQTIINTITEPCTAK